MSFIHNVLKIKKALYFPGCVTDLLLKDIKDNYKAILSDLPIGFTMEKPFQCCGAPLLHSGHKDEFLALVEKNKQMLEKKGFSKIIVNCPHCYHMFKKYYAFPVEHMSQVLQKHSRKISRTKTNEVNYHDPCFLGRKNCIYEEPRAVIRATGAIIEEVENRKEKSLCCGAGGLMNASSPKIANNIAKNTLKQFKKDIVVTCPLCYMHLKENKPKDFKIFELSEMLIEI